METGIQIFFQIVNSALLIGGVAAAALLVAVLLKLNKALNIWLGKNK